MPITAPGFLRWYATQHSARIDAELTEAFRPACSLGIDARHSRTSNPTWNDATGHHLRR
jgi:hypothetical protein